MNKHHPAKGRPTVDSLQHCGLRHGHTYCVSRPGHANRWHSMARPGERAITSLCVSNLTITFAGPT